ncbi:hypothetical protein CXG81DRAFT_19076 [Caulochytrium protostelioides]|uniref:Uncharacterized protein n=1 Tax=Caulochytrium protostelioides TaxID=1555241 RepID=A0A4P9X7A0_9FUNG|nr:hypothetical protein CXG81DRAFT_19076 [Caulochytrium protostelioides]|eukprot:RKP01082.1 hypothetical protein CXG81DRAFT_19076 [Caulochytrium protostelioides]
MANDARPTPAARPPRRLRPCTTAAAPRWLPRALRLTSAAAVLAVVGCLAAVAAALASSSTTSQHSLLAAEGRRRPVAPAAVDATRRGRGRGRGRPAADPVIAGESLRNVLHLTDLHFDPYYEPNTPDATLCHRSRRKTQGAAAAAPPASEPASAPLSASDAAQSLPAATPRHQVKPDQDDDDSSHFYGRINTECDAPLSLIADALDRIPGVAAEALRDTAPRGLDAVLWTGDSSRHDRDPDMPKTIAELREQTAAMARLVGRVFQPPAAPTGTAVYPSVGNWDVFPAGQLADARDGMNDQLTHLWTLWLPLLRHATRNDTAWMAAVERDFLHGGYYVAPLYARDDDDGAAATNATASETPVWVVALNTLYWFDENNAVGECAYFHVGSDPDAGTAEPDDMTPGTRQLVWLNSVLLRAEAEGAVVLLTGHVPPLNTKAKSLYTPRCLMGIKRLWARFRDQLLAGFYGHTNDDTTFLVYRHEVPQSAGAARASAEDGADDEYPGVEIVPIAPDTIETTAWEAGEPIGLFYTGVSIYPVANPGFRLMTLRIPGRPSSAALAMASPSRALPARFASQEQWYASLPRANLLHDQLGATHNTLKFRAACHTTRHLDLPLTALPANATTNATALDAKAWQAFALRSQREVARAKSLTASGVTSWPLASWLPSSWLPSSWLPSSWLPSSWLPSAWWRRLLLPMDVNVDVDDPHREDEADDAWAAAETGSDGDEAAWTAQRKPKGRPGLRAWKQYVACQDGHLYGDPEAPAPAPPILTPSQALWLIGAFTLVFVALIAAGRVVTAREEQRWRTGEHAERIRLFGA